ncbi:MAG: hypothetical protein OEW93_11625 [Candidatus Bathyarchaeota archaeon]|nr:hypothetical protein [Candidatus Bathyarchaeota archaeon]
MAGEPRWEEGIACPERGVENRPSRLPAALWVAREDEGTSLLGGRRNASEAVVRPAAAALKETNGGPPGTSGSGSVSSCW